MYRVHTIMYPYWYHTDSVPGTGTRTVRVRNEREKKEEKGVLIMTSKLFFEMTRLFFGNKIEFFFVGRLFVYCI